MNNEALLKDPVFQLNLLVWMAKEQPETDYLVRPLFFERDFGIIYIENTFDFPEEVGKAISAASLDISSLPQPDLILGRIFDNRALYFEAKADSFGTESVRNCRQARGHLLACGPAFTEVFPPYETTLLCYVVPEDCRGKMSACLSSLYTELESSGFSPGPFSVQGFEIAGDLLNYTWDELFAAHTGLVGESAPILGRFESDYNPLPLILIFSEEDCSDSSMVDLYRQATIRKVHAFLLSDLRSTPPGQMEYETTPDKLLNVVSEAAFQYLGTQRQKGLRSLVRENILKRIFDYWGAKSCAVTLDFSHFSVTWSSVGEKEAFLDWLEDKRTRFDAGPPKEVYPLFEELPSSEAEV